eukprot:TRINITY_DN4203_c0_g1_i3.p2 TRINITY_DN4203_c0_g1~~TRINITY_DN4203_c0_g1_i3.p2  ORF type:complete len:359 (+),score=196.46 TRINITY_DN4203_c0_g1_i3:151-1077(+)
MILLETPNRIIGDALRARLALANDPNARPEPLDITFAEFDDVMYHLTSSADEPHLVTVSLALKCFATLQAHGAAAVIAARFGAMAQAAPEAGHDLTLVVDTRAFPDDAAAREAQVDAVASVKRHVFSGPLEQVFDAVAKGAEGGDTIAVQYRPNETMWIVPQKEQVVVVFSVEFRDASDIPIAKVFLQEFAEARRQAGLGAAPPVSYTDEVPLELKGLDVQTAPNKSFVSFVVFPRNFEGAKREGTINMLHQFRDYLHFHIKASKGYMHSRMRASVVQWLKVLKQAVPEHPGGEKEKKTASGRTFVRK